MDPKPVSSLAPYASAFDLLVRYDYTTVGDLLVDGRNATKPDASILVNPLTPEGARLKALLMKASGYVESAALMGKRYLPGDLECLISIDPMTGNPRGGNMAELLKGLVCDLAMWELYKRRPNPDAQLPAAYREAQQWLSALEDGTTLFGIERNIDATHLKSEVENPGIVDQRRMWTKQAAPYFGRRGNRGGGV